jgi:hypothetical protein
MLDTTAVETTAAGGETLPAVSAPAKIAGICLLGSHPATVNLAPYHDASWLIYACSPDNSPGGRGAHAAARPRVDVWFELHQPVEHETRPFGYLKYVSDLPVVYMRDQKAMPYFKGARLYPDQEMKAKFCPFLFTSSIAYMMAKAIVDCEEQGIPQIALYGIMQSGNVDPQAAGSLPEYQYQRPGTQYFIWEATRRGIKVLAAKESRLFELPKDVW